MLPIIALTHLEDARVLFDVLNDAAVSEKDPEKRQRLNLLLVATYAELARLRKS